MALSLYAVAKVYAVTKARSPLLRARRTNFVKNGPKIEIVSTLSMNVSTVGHTTTDIPLTATGPFWLTLFSLGVVVAEMCTLTPTRYGLRTKEQSPSIGPAYLPWLFMNSDIHWDCLIPRLKDL